MKKDPVSSQFDFHPSMSEWHDAVALLLPDISISPFVGKSLYFFGITRHVIDAASKLYKDKYNLPALSLGCSMVELLGRCILGDNDHDRMNQQRFKVGFNKIVKASFPYKNDNDLIVRTSSEYSYSYENIVTLRNFGAHGFSGTKESSLYIDRHFIGWLFGAIGETINDYFCELKEIEDTAKNMAKAGISPLIFNERPIHIKKMYKFIQQEGQPGDFHYKKYWENEYLEVKSLNSPG